MSTISSESDLIKALDAGTVIFDLRQPVSAEAFEGVYHRIEGAVTLPCDPSTGAVLLSGLPTNKESPLIIHCRSGGRATRAAAFLAEQGYQNILNAGGPKGPEVCTNRI